MALERLRLGVNIDHVATLRNARGGTHPDTLRAAEIVKAAGCDGLTLHLREDRRHIVDDDLERLRAADLLPINLEMAVTDEMLAIAIRARPHACCLVPEKRAERTTEHGLDVLGMFQKLVPFVTRLRAAGIRVSLFIDPEPGQVIAAKRLGAPVVELHTGSYCDALDETARAHELERIKTAAAACAEHGIECHAGHGLTYDTVAPIAAIPNVRELNIGHFLVGEAVFVGLEAALREMRRRMDEARG